MTPEDEGSPGLDPLTEIFHTARELPAAERRAYVERACAGDDDLLAEVLPLLGLHQPEPSGGGSDRGDAEILDTGAVRSAVEALSAPRGLLGRRIEDYELRELLGVGGMGAVYLGVRVTGGFEQRAAVKLLPMGMDTPPARWRFHQERRLLAALSHPAVAQLHGGGLTDDGSPYLIMEYVDGQPLTEYCAERKLPERERLDLFLSVCGAVQHAHEHLVVHRDLKPANILVTADGLPKLLDFGIARDLDEERRAPPGEMTRMGPAFTAAYASPEQMSGEELTTASDVFALGVVLFELLSGDRLFASEPPRDHDGAMGKLRRTLHGDLARIVGATLREDPRERYQTVALLAEDIRRFMERRPVRATPPTLRYRLGRLVARRPAELALGALIVFFIVYSLSQTLQARLDARRAYALNAFMSSAVLDLAPFGDPAAVGSLTAALDSALALLEADPLEPRTAHLDALGSIGGAYLRLGREERALPLLQAALGPGRGSHPDSTLARLHYDLGLAHLELDHADSARRHLESALARYAAQPVSSAAPTRATALLDSLSVPGEPRE